MPSRSKTRCIGILTSGGDCPGLNAAIRGITKAAHQHGIRVLGITDGFRGLVENRFRTLEDREVSGILTLGGTLLGTSRDKPHKMSMGDRVMDMTDVAVANAKAQQVDCLICLGGNGTQKNAQRIQKAGLQVLTLPKTIDNDVAMTDVSFGYDTALETATEAIDRLHTTAISHDRIIVCELMGHKAGWLALGAGIAGGADVILIPELPYDVNAIAEHLIDRRKHNKRFSIIAVAEGAISHKEFAEAQQAKKDGARAKKEAKNDPKVERAKLLHEGPHLVQESLDSRIARQLQALTGLEARTTSLGHVQRGGTPTGRDRLICTLLGTKAVEMLAAGKFNQMMAIRGNDIIAVPLADVAGKTKIVSKDHSWIQAARDVDTCLG